ncbi:MBL fold metallo-hydrolase [Paenibacillus protaetiae]|uniref:MBL fold metallo-hydrolase n=2 Tax=Paenibacillus protaetiae TaxID=2509456 RepID=A0A4P6F503_9BACL|nr:MBL fold metallo-hydrolase [Paenibacillus protaetiae]
MWEDGWIQVKVPLPFSLRWVNSYVLPEQDGYTVIDPGLHTEEAVAAWDEVMSRFGFGYGDIRQIVLTHQHPDHYGLAGYFQKRSGAPVYLTAQAHAYTQRMWGEGGTLAGELAALFREHGMPAELTHSIEQNLESFKPLVSPQPQVTYIQAGQTMAFGGLEWSLIDAPGHARGALVFYNAGRKIALCGDQVMPRITPNVSVVPGEDADPLASFMDSLAGLESLGVKLAFPGHRDPFDGFAKRTAELRQHHERRLAQMLEQLYEPHNGFELCELHFGERLRTNPHNLRFAMAETLAHLYYLEKRGVIARSESENDIVYRRV